MSSDLRKRPSDETAISFVSIGKLLGRGVSVSKLATAIEISGVYTHDQFDRLVVADSAAIAEAMDALLRQHDWESESPIHKRTHQSPLDEWGDAWHAPYARSGWPDNNCPDFDVLIASATFPSKVKESPQQRQERIRARVREEKARGTKNFLVIVAKEEKLSTSRIKQLVDEDPKPKGIWSGLAKPKS